MCNSLDMSQVQIDTEQRKNLLDLSRTGSGDTINTYNRLRFI